jgi:hypothetical protein
MLKSLVYLNWFLNIACDEGVNLSFCMWICGFLNTTYWRDFPFSVECSWNSCQKSIDHKCMYLFLSCLNLFH